MDSHFLLLEIFPTQGLNPGLPHCRQTLYRLSHQGSQTWAFCIGNSEPYTLDPQESPYIYFLNIYVFDSLVLGCRRQDLRCMWDLSLRHTNSLVVALELSGYGTQA